MMGRWIVNHYSYAAAGHSFLLFVQKKRIKEKSAGADFGCEATPVGAIKTEFNLLP